MTRRQKSSNEYLNIYRHIFFAVCPDNEEIIAYRLTIKAGQMINVSEIESKTDSFDRGYHEEFADELFEAFGGLQTLKARHHGTDIETKRGALT